MTIFIISVHLHNFVFLFVYLFSDLFEKEDFINTFYYFIRVKNREIFCTYIFIYQVYNFQIFKMGSLILEKS